MGGKAFRDDVTMPVRQRDLLGMLGKMIPEGLNVFEFLVRRELVEARRRKGRLRHDQVYRRRTGVPRDATTAEGFGFNARGVLASLAGRRAQMRWRR